MSLLSDTIQQITTPPRPRTTIYNRPKVHLGRKTTEIEIRRAEILLALRVIGPATTTEIMDYVSCSRDRVRKSLERLREEGLVQDEIKVENRIRKSFWSLV
jgi:predicted transcriptional regulator